MSRAEADVWAADSLYTRSVFHVTTHEAASLILPRGFDLSYRAGGRTWGNGVYAAIDEETCDFYLRQLGEHGVVLELSVNIRRMLRVRFSQSTSRPAFEQVLALIPEGLRRFVDARLVASDRTAAFTRVIAEAGYDALEIIEDRFSMAVGGSQLVIYDPKRVVVIADETTDSS